jgi:hypothetical protein
MRLYLIALAFILTATSCTHRVYWPQNPGRRGAISVAPASIDVLEEGRDYQGWSPAPAKCQQKPFPFHVSKN